MCSVLTLFTHKKFSSDFKKSADTLLQQSKLRGPDDSNSIILNNQIFLGSNRLQIIGSPGQGRMPLKSLNAECWIVLNGEIYNHKELRLDLQNLGLKFNTDTDTEVIVNSYIAWGLDFITKLNGIFSFVIYDEKNKKIIASRDRFGAKPLYYFVNKDLLSFASDFLTIRDIASSFVHLKIRKESLSTFMKLRFVPGEATIYDNIFKVNPAEYICVDLQNVGFLKKQKYWKPFIQLKKFDQEEFNTKLNSAIIRSATSDVPSGLLLSGGLDSSTILAILKNKNHAFYATFSCAFEGATTPEEQEINSKKITTTCLDETQLAVEVANWFRTHNQSYNLNLNCGLKAFISM